ncbi:LacI family DNA-binding transcriptional regulator [Salipiger marinus]|uniref:LacI family DNA-binding transcriptional regulator n=1 Tax=Salipiger marinus TaxID=555512 RepID=UPI001E57DAB8|nr:LacI family DNA-binding transcriptional regulator [Salipiger manganoxidans]MCD1618017.1 LacI family DNA-binding transcriptional regulator [Salipiger manganoxidans]MEB3418698.1 LacI family DNA-binding transcriptional regulator [Salipiger manganoxidans]
MTKLQKETIYDIAQKAGASASTVSAALNGTWKKRRIAKVTAERIIAIAQEQGYSANLQARALRTSRSGLVALLIPEYNRFFSNIAQTFSAEVRARNQCPVIISTARDPEEERRTVSDLTAWNIDAIFFVGSVAPEDLSRHCTAAQVPHVFVDQPCAIAPSVVTDSRTGAHILTREIIASMRARGVPIGASPRDTIYFVGGDRLLPSTRNRVEGFSEALYAHLGRLDPDQIIAQTYDLDAATASISALYTRLGGLPRGLFINSDSVFEGALRFLATLPEAELTSCSFGVFDYEPYGQLLRFPVHMMRQRHKMLVHRAFALLDEASPPVIEMVQPELYPAPLR